MEGEGVGRGGRWEDSMKGQRIIAIVIESHVRTMIPHLGRELLDELNIAISVKYIQSPYIVQYVPHMCVHKYHDSMCCILCACTKYICPPTCTCTS